MARKKIVKFSPSGFCCFYLRVSTTEQVESGLGLIAQGKTCERKAEQLGLVLRREHWDNTTKVPRDGHFVDESESAWKKRLTDRPGGQRLLATLQPGDTLIVLRLDRAWRSMADFIAVADDLTKRGIRLVVCAQNIDLGTASGRMFAKYLVALAEWESDRKSERQILAHQHRKEKTRLKSRMLDLSKSETLPSDWRPLPKADKDLSTKLPGKIYCYVRCSHRDSATSGNGIRAQMEVTGRYARGLMHENPALDLERDFVDPAVSATCFDLRNRPDGRRLHNVIQKGDHVVFASLDRGFRSILDMATTMPEWEARGVHVHFVNEGICMDDAAGRMMANAIVCFAEYEAQIISQRTKEAKAIASAKGRYQGGGCPSFWKIVTVREWRTETGTRKSQKVLCLNKKALRTFRMIEWLRSHGLTKNQAFTRVEQRMARKEKRIEIPFHGCSRMSKIGKQLVLDDPNYPFDSQRRAFPMWYCWNYKIAKPHFEAAMEAWRKVTETRRRLAKAPLEKPTYEKVRLSHRGHLLDNTLAIREWRLQHRRLPPIEGY